MSATCPRDNATSLQCEHGCCGNSANQKCCSFESSETLIIIACVGGALVVFTGVILLVCCITKKKKDAVTPIPPRRRQEYNRDVERRRRMQIMMEMPKPPPYSEAPPEYNSWNENNRNTPTVPSRSGTEYNQVVPSTSSQGQNNSDSPHPSTSGNRAISVVSNHRILTQSDIHVASRASNVENTGMHINRNRSQGSARQDRPQDNEYYRNTDKNGNEPSRDSRHETRQRADQSTVQITFNTRPPNRHTLDYSERTMSRTELPGGVQTIPESPPPKNPAAALRSAKRKAILLHLENRRVREVDMSTSSDDE